MNVICEVSKDCISISKVDMRVEGEEVVEGREGCKVEDIRSMPCREPRLVF